jgi:hypothetical protein
MTRAAIRSRLQERPEMMLASLLARTEEVTTKDFVACLIGCFGGGDCRADYEKPFEITIITKITRRVR